MRKAYVSGALTHVENRVAAKAFYEAIGSLCEEIGFQAYVPHRHGTDPDQNLNVSHRQVFDIDKYQVSASDLVVAYVGSPSLGVGMELAYAEMNSIPIILLYEKGRRLSRFARGIRTIVSEIQFNDYEDALAQLKSVLRQWAVTVYTDEFADQ